MPKIGKSSMRPSLRSGPRNCGTPKARQVRPITRETRHWKSDPDLTPPINGRDIPGFRNWVNWDGYREEYTAWYEPKRSNHNGVDLATYMNDADQCIIGLPEGTEVLAIADGRVTRSYGPDVLPGYCCYIVLEHSPCELWSEYHHVIPTVQSNQEVKKGQSIGTLYKDPGSRRGRLVHLHFSLVEYFDSYVDPAQVFPDLFPLTAYPPDGRWRFRLVETGLQPDIVIANFKKLVMATHRKRVWF